MTVELSDQEMMRYNRQIVLRGFDFEGQEALKAASVLVVGLGGLGCAAAQYLAAAGAGSMTLLDFDTVSVSNLQRQTLHSDATLGQPKVDSARDALARINPHVQLTTLNAVLEEEALRAQIAAHDLVPPLQPRHRHPLARFHLLPRSIFRLKRNGRKILAQINVHLRGKQ